MKCDRCGEEKIGGMYELKAEKFMMTGGGYIMSYVFCEKCYDKIANRIERYVEKNVSINKS